MTYVKYMTTRMTSNMTYVRIYDDVYDICACMTTRMTSNSVNAIETFFLNKTTKKRFLMPSMSRNLIVPSLER